MQLPIRLSAAQDLLGKYTNMVTSYIGSENIYCSQLFAELESFKERVVHISETMLRQMGYTGNLLEMETKINESILELQKGTNFLNGEALGDFFIWELAKAAPYSFSLQNAYQKFLQNEFNITTEEELQRVDFKSLAADIFQLAGYDLSNYTLVMSKDGTTVQGIGKKGGSTPKLHKTTFFREMTGRMQEILKPLLEKAGLIEKSKVDTDNGIKFSFEINDKTVFNFLKLKTTPYRGKNNDLEDITSLMKKDPDLFTKVKDVFIAKLMNEYNGSSKEAFQKAINHIFGKMEPKDLFAGENAQRKIIGLLGELQALYYIYALIPNANANWTATEGSIQPHADLVLELLGKQYGIQVKNTILEGAKQEVAFETFKTDLIDSINSGNLEVNFLKTSKEQFNDTIIQNPTLFEAATTLLGMESFNIPYVWEENEAHWTNMHEVPAFTETRIQILESAEKARKALTSFVVGMMYMQLSPLKANEANTLYIIGGTLAITSAHILMDIIDNLESRISKFNINLISVTKDGHTEINNIVDFLNTKGKHLGITQYVLESSYTFEK